MERRLAAILAADLVGYSRLMGADEEGTLARLQALKDSVLDPGVAEHRGRIVKTTGDGMLVEFASALDAVNCAIALQTALAGQASGVATDQRLDLRIGINVGDVIFERDDIYGDGVNIAARLEGIARPGGICISRTVYDHLGGRANLGFRHGGAHDLKNIARPIEIWRWDAASTGSEQESAQAPPAKPSVAVLPFVNMSGDAEQEYFADGIAEDLITSLSKLSQLMVIARNSSFSYKGRSVKVQEIARDLGVRYLVEGSVRKAGNRVRITAQLIDCADGGHLWAERYDRDLTDIFEVQDEVTREIITSLSVKLAPGDAERLETVGTENVEAYELFLRGRDVLYRYTPEDNRQSRETLEASRDIDPDFAPAAAFLCYAHLLDYINQWVDDSGASLATSHRLAQEAVALDPAYPSARLALGHVLVWMRQHDQAIAEYEEAVALDPNFADAYMTMGWAQHFAGRPEEAVRLIRRGFLLDPNYAPMRLHWLAQVEYQLGHFEEAADLLKRRLARQPHSDISNALLASAYGQLGDAEAAREAWAALQRINPEFSIEQRRRVLPYKNPADFELFVEGLEKAGIVV
ncbi:MAG: adenylate/guanylate cyclase domain-containing protein [Alphaproteobacteria bacterium]